MINVSCFCFGSAGVQNHGRYFLEALSEYDSISLFPWDPIPPIATISPILTNMLENAWKIDPANIGLGIGVMNKMDQIIGDEKISFTIWETTRIPDKELEKISHSRAPLLIEDYCPIFST